ncbi:signal peptidase I [Tengunoibacter tsumagoiensis]|uniref:signal peptidase I n=1 Tax=Tengunoibacter tsumagoiensis TaxID=2014871 RepID=UPI000F83B1DC|nr:signal peptidase I [Tengunoibacter tsumagoiensis]
MEQNFEKRNRLIREIIETVVLTALMFFIINIAVQNYTVDGPSMENSLHDGERIMVDKVSYQFHAPARGDVVVFIAPPHPEENYVKRIIAIPGDVVTIKGNDVTVDGVTLHETYVTPTRQGNSFYNRPGYPVYDHFVLPKDKYLALGDDRINSSDSRDWGLLPRSNIIGRAALVYWPIIHEDNAGFLPNVSSVFANVHQEGTKTATHAPDSAISWQNSGAMALLIGPGLILGAVGFSRRWGRR